MSIKFLAIALVAILSLQGCVKAKSINLVDERGTIEDIGKVIEEIKASLEKLVIEGITAVKDAVKEIVEEAQEALNKAIAKIDKLLESVIFHILKLIALVIESGFFDIKECIETQVPRLETLVQETKEAVKTCVADLAAEAEKAKEDLVAAISAASKNILALEKELKACQNQKCRVVAAKALVKELISVKFEVKNIIVNSVQDIKAKLPAAVQCIHNQVAVLGTELAAIGADVQKCIEESQIGTQMANRGILEEGQKLIEKFKEAVKNLVEQSLTALKEAQDKVLQLIAETQKKIQALAETIKAEIEEFKKEAAKLGEHVEECVIAAAAKVDQLVAESQGKLDECVKPAAASVNQIIQNAEDVVRGVVKEAENLIETAAGCKWNPTCWINTANEFTKLMVDIQPRLMKLIDDSRTSLTAATADLAECSGPVIQAYTDGMKEIRSEIKQCLVSN